MGIAWKGLLVQRQYGSVFPNLKIDFYWTAMFRLPRGTPDIPGGYIEEGY
jgi:hypothetical protein